MELPKVTALSPPVFVSHFFDRIARGREISLVHLLEIADPGETGDTYDCATLPGDVISTDLPRIAAAVAMFQRVEAP